MQHRYLTFISPNGPYHGTNNYTSSNAYRGVCTVNQYFARPTDVAAISFTALTTLTGINYIYGYPTFISNYYDPN